MKINSTTVLVDGKPVDMGIGVEVTNGRTYFPLRFLAEIFESVTWDEENEIIDIEDESQDGLEDNTDKNTRDDIDADSVADEVINNTGNQLKE